MKIAVASGKGGTGKTIISTSLALSLSEQYDNVHYFDCDVEAPNGHIFLKPEYSEEKPLGIDVPVVDFNKCDYCGACAEACEFSAILVARKKLMVFNELCHGCYACQLVCHADAINMEMHQTAVYKKGHAGKINFVEGRLNLGEPMPTPIIANLKKMLPKDGIVIIDSPPGNSDSMVEAVIDTDFVLLVTEPTPFGLHDLKLAVETVKLMNVPMGIIANRADLGTKELWEYAKEEDIPVLMEIPFLREIAEGYSRGVPLVEVKPELKKDFIKLYEKINTIVGAKER